MNNFYRYLDLPFEIKTPDALFDVKYPHPFNEENITEKYGYFDDNMQNLVTSLGADLDEVEAFFTSPGDSIPIHHDGDRLCKINISYGVEGGIIRWYNARKKFSQQPRISDDQRKEAIRCANLGIPHFFLWICPFHFALTTMDRDGVQRSRPEWVADTLAGIVLKIGEII